MLKQIVYNNKNLRKSYYKFFNQQKNYFESEEVSSKYMMNRKGNNADEQTERAFHLTKTIYKFLT